MPVKPWLDEVLPSYEPLIGEIRIFAGPFVPGNYTAIFTHKVFDGRDWLPANERNLAKVAKRLRFSLCLPQPRSLRGI